MQHPADRRYSAFISYNHRDRRWAAWLHRSLETYSIPKKLRGRPSPIGELGVRLPPVFQDREELASATDLSASVSAALERADTLVVICSPAGAASRWVNEEIKAFVALGRRDRIFCLVVGGEPGASTRPRVDGVDEAFPPSLIDSGSEPLAADVRKHGDGRDAAKLKLLAGILAVPYDELRQREAARRQKRLLAIAVASAIGVVITSSLAGAALVARAEAVHQRDIARQRTVTAERTVDFVKSMFRVSDPSEARGASISAREILDRGRVQLSRGLASEPAVKADLGTTLGEVYLGLGLFRDGRSLIEQTFAINRTDPDVLLRQTAALGDALSAQGEYQPAAAAYRRALSLERRSGADRRDLESRLLVGIGNAISFGGDTKAAEPSLRAALDIDRRRGRVAGPDVARDLEALASNAFGANDLPRAAALARSALDLRVATQGEFHPAVSDDLNLLGSVAYLQRDARSAEGYYRRVLKADETVLGPNHPDLATTLNNLSRVLLEQRRFDDAAALLVRSLAITLRERGAEHQQLAFTYANLGLARRGQGATAEGEALMSKAVDVARTAKHRNLAPAMTDLADMLCARGKVARGLALLATARPLMAKTYPADAWRTAWVDNVRAGCLAATGDRKAARALFVASLPSIKARWAPGTLYGRLVRDRAAALG